MSSSVRPPGPGGELDPPLQMQPIDLAAKGTAQAVQFRSTSIARAIVPLRSSSPSGSTGGLSSQVTPVAAQAASKSVSVSRCNTLSEGSSVASSVLVPVPMTQPVSVAISRQPNSSLSHHSSVPGSGSGPPTRPPVMAVAPPPAAHSAASHVASFHVPRGAAAVASLANPRAALATPILRPNTTHPSTGVSVTTIPVTRQVYPGGLCGSGSSTAHPRVGTSAATTTTAVVSSSGGGSAGAGSTTWLPASSTVGSVPPTHNATPTVSINLHKTAVTVTSAAIGTSAPVTTTTLNQSRAVAVSTVGFSQVRATSIAVNARAPTPPNRIGAESWLPMITNATKQNQSQHGHIHLAEKSFLKAVPNLTTPTTITTTTSPLPRLHPPISSASSSSSSLPPSTNAHSSAPNPPSTVNTSTALVTPSPTQLLTPVAMPIPGQARLSIATVSTTSLAGPTMLATTGGAPFVSVPVTATPITIKAGSQPTILPAAGRGGNLTPAVGSKILAQSGHGPAIHISQVPLSMAKAPLQTVQTVQAVHPIASLQPAAVVATTSMRTVTYTAAVTSGVSSMARPSGAPAPPAPASQSVIPVAKVYPQPVQAGCKGGATAAAQLEVNTAEILQQNSHPQAVGQTQNTVSANLYIHTTHRASPIEQVAVSGLSLFAAPPSQSTGERPSSVPTYSLPTAAYYYDTSTGYQVAATPLVAHHYTSSSVPYSVQTTATTIRPGGSTVGGGAAAVHSIVTAAPVVTTPGTSVRINPVMVLDHRSAASGRPASVPVTSYTDGLTSSSGHQLVHDGIPQSPQHYQTTLKPNVSPRPSILRKRDTEGSISRVQKNLTATLSALPSSSSSLHHSLPTLPLPSLPQSSSSSCPPSPPPSSPRRPNSAGNGHSSNGSTTISATSSPGVPLEGNEDSSSMKQEAMEDEVISTLPPFEVSPRKKPRKQQFVEFRTHELHETRSSEEDMEFLTDERLTHGGPAGRSSMVDEEERPYVPKKPRVYLLNTYKHQWKSRHNHFQRYSDVKPKDERRPTVSELANQKQVLQKVQGWKIFHLGTQMEDLVDLEAEVYGKLSQILRVMENDVGKDERDLNGINELIKGNMQRSKVIKDQVSEAKCQVVKIVDHKHRVTDIVNKYINKRPIKKRDKT